MDDNIINRIFISQGTPTDTSKSGAFAIDIRVRDEPCLVINANDAHVSRHFLPRLIQMLEKARGVLDLLTLAKTGAISDDVLIDLINALSLSEGSNLELTEYARRLSKRKDN